jgi:hypothetical protein
MDTGHRLDLGINCFTTHEILCSPRTSNEGDINLHNDSVPRKVGVENRTHAHKLWVEEDGRKGVLTAPILMKDRYIDTRVHSSVAYPSNLLTEFGHPDVWLEKVAVRGTKN